MPDVSTATVDVRGHALKLQRAGKGAPVIVLNELFGPQGWAPWLDALSARHEVTLPEHPGFGGVEPPAWLDRVADLSNFYLDFLDARDLKGVHLVGVGGGGWIAAELATRNCARLASLTLVAPLGLRVQDHHQADIFLGGDDDVLRLLVHDAAKADKLIADTITPETEDLRLHNQVVLARVAWDPRLHDPHLAKWLHRATIPAFVVAGDDDKLFPRVYAKAWTDRIRGARAATLAACGHFPQYEKPDELASAILGFLAEQRA